MPTGDKIDLFKRHKSEYAASSRPKLVDVDEGTYLAIEGTGAPGGEDFQKKVEALYGVAYTVKMTRKSSGEKDYVVGKLEAQWWSDGADAGASGFSLGDAPRDRWRWRLMIRTPEFVEEEELERAASVLIEKGKDPTVKEVGLRTVAEGRCVQMLHVGPYDREAETMEAMRSFAEAEGLKPSGRHHEIYVSDPRRVPPEKLKTILRMPVG
jgi:hypothetical protein